MMYLSSKSQDKLNGFLLPLCRPYAFSLPLFHAASMHFPCLPFMQGPGLLPGATCLLPLAQESWSRPLVHNFASATAQVAAPALWGGVPRAGLV